MPTPTPVIHPLLLTALSTALQVSIHPVCPTPSFPFHQLRESTFASIHREHLRFVLPSQRASCSLCRKHHTISENHAIDKCLVVERGQQHQAPCLFHTTICWQISLATINKTWFPAFPPTRPSFSSLVTRSPPPVAPYNHQQSTHSPRVLSPLRKSRRQIPFRTSLSIAIYDSIPIRYDFHVRLIRYRCRLCILDCLGVANLPKSDYTSWEAQYDNVGFVKKKKKETRKTTIRALIDHQPYF